MRCRSFRCLPVRTVTPVRNDTPPSHYDFPLPPVGSGPEPDRDNPVAYGAYLGGPLGHCIECHSTPDENGVPDMENHLGAGGKSDEERRKIITTGIRADGTALKLPMPVSYYEHLEEADLDAIIAYLRTLPPR